MDNGLYAPINQHRDLHWGQIVIRRIPDPTGPNGSSAICATIIDLGLARILVDGTVRFLPFEEECFTGKGVLPNFDDVGDDGKNLFATIIMLY